MNSASSSQEADTDVASKHEHEEIISEGIPAEVVSPTELPPDGGYGWVCMGAAFMINGFTWGIIASYGVYLSYYLSHDVFHGARDIDYAFVGGANFSSALVTSPIVNLLLRSFGTHTVMFTGCVIWLVGWIAASFANSLWQLVLSQGLCIGIGLGLIWQPSSGIVSQWFSRRRSMAQGITSAGSGVIGIIYSTSTTPMIESIGLRWALRITGITSFVMLLVACYLIRDRNSVIRPTIDPFDTKLLKKYQVWMVIGYSVFNLLGYIVFLYSLGSYGTSLGLSQYQSGVIITLINAGTAIGRGFIGVISDRLGRITVGGSLSLISGVACFAWWINATTYASVLAMAMVIGMTFSSYWATIAPIAAEVVDLVDLPSLLCLLWLVDMPPTLFSEPIALALRQEGSDRPYLYTQIYAGICYLIGGAFLVELRRNKLGLSKWEKHR